MRGNDLTSALKRRIEARADVTVSARDDASVWVVVDRFLLVEALAAIASRLHTECGVRHIELTMGRRAGHAELDLAWRAAPLTPEVGRAWQRAPLGAPGVGGGASFEDVMQRHGGEALYNEDADAAYFRVLLPLADHGAAAMTWPDAPSRPTFYDFDLFNQPGQSAELDQRLLAELSYTVFDTETTGLAPSQGDEIVSIGAVRIVNGRLLEAETFDQLVNPRRALSTASIRVHGITGEMLQSAPTIERALPAFHRFCEDTVLVAHNAAFDLRFVQLKERACGVCFDQPVLDTLMLSAVVHPSQPDHTLEAIAARFGIGVVGRHTALGDALVTAEIFLKMIPLLEAQGIRTLGEAREAASRTAYARIGY